MDRVLRPRNKRKDPSNDEEVPQIKKTTVEKKPKKRAAKENSRAQNNNEKTRTELKTTVVHTFYYARNLSEDMVINHLDKFKMTTNFMDEQGLSHFHVACMVGHIKMVEAMLKGGVELNKPTSALDPVNKCQNNSALHFAVEHLQVKVVKLLLKFKADVNAKNSEGRTPLHFACSIKNKYVKVLIEHYRRDPKAKAYIDTEPEIQIINLLLKHKANKEARDIYNNTPLLFSFTYSYYDLLEYCEILDKRAPPDKSYFHALSKVQLMAKRHQLKKMKLLVNSGANPRATNVYGNNILHLIIENLHHQRQPAILSDLSFKDGINADAIKFILTTNKVNVDAKNNIGDTPLTLAVSYLSFQIVKVLLHYKAEVDTIELYFSRHGSLYFKYADTVANYVAVDNLLDITIALEKKGRFMDLSDNTPVLLFLEGVREPSDDTSVLNRLVNGRINYWNRQKKTQDFLIYATGQKLHNALRGEITDDFSESLIKLKRAINIGKIYYEPELLFWLRGAQILDLFQAATHEYEQIQFTRDHKALREEVEIMKGIFVGGKSLLDLLRSKPAKIYRFIYLNRKEALSVLNRYKTTLFRYKKFIEAHFTKALIRHYYVQAAKDYFCELTKVTFPCPCVENICGYLEQEDLKNLCLAAVRVNVTYNDTSIRI